MALTGSETLQVLGQDLTGRPAATTETTTTGEIAGLAGVNPTAPTATGASATAEIGGTYLLDTAAGSVLTLPAATGTGGAIRVVVTTTATSNAHKVLAAANDFLQGMAIGQNSGTCKAFSSDGATQHSLQMPFAGTQPSGGFIGDSFTLVDIATHKWQVTGSYQAGTTPTTPFSTATT